MSQNNIAEVIIHNDSRNVDKIYHYKVPEAFMEKVQIGMRVLVPFGNGNKKTEAFIAGLTDSTDISRLKAISDIVDDMPLFDEKLLSLIKWMKNTYLCTLYEALKAVLPPGIGLKLQEWISLTQGADIQDARKRLERYKTQLSILELLLDNGGSIEYTRLTAMLDVSGLRKSIQALCTKGIVQITNKCMSTVKDKTIRVVYLALSYEETQYYIDHIRIKAPVQARILEILMDNEFVSAADLVMFSQGSYSALNALYKKGIIDYRDHPVPRDPYRTKEFTKTFSLRPTEEQENVIKLVGDKVNEGIYDAVLLRGVTGSGKTEVFLQVIDKVIANGKQAIVLVPEISLTPQMVERFMGRFGSRVAVLHSGLSIGERYDQWKKIRNAEVDVVVGARSAIFAPCRNLGIIILDEEHENSYKSETAPRYHAREVALRRGKIERAVVLFASATPSIESYYKAKSGSYKLVEMNKRYNDISLPEVEVIDMRTELADGNKSIFSNRLKTEIGNNLMNGQQTILFLNRRGYSTFVSCRSCGNVLTCPHCSISLTYHINSDTLTCHYCGYTIKNVVECPKCKSRYVKYFGIGTQKVEQEIMHLFPDASVIRMDVDTTGTKFSHEKILNKFRDEKIDILIGTQMVSKGLDFPNVTLVGVLAADMSLNIDDYRSSERTFQLMTQVCGRAGRGNIKGRALIQTYQPEHYTIQLAKNHDYLGFYGSEINVRKQLNYPPFCQIISIVMTGTDEEQVIRSIKSTTADFQKNLRGHGYEKCCMGILGPIPCGISRIKNKYRWRILIKCIDCKEIRIILYELICAHYRQQGKNKNSEINLIVDINPINLY